MKPYQHIKLISGQNPHRFQKRVRIHSNNFIDILSFTLNPYQISKKYESKLIEILSAISNYYQSHWNIISIIDALLPSLKSYQYYWNIIIIETLSVSFKRYQLYWNISNFETKSTTSYHYQHCWNIISNLVTSSALLKHYQYYWNIISQK